MAVVNPVAGAAIVGGGFILSATGEGLTGYANYSQGDYGALAGQVGEFAAEQAVGHYFGKLGKGALRDATTGRFRSNPLGGAFRNAKKEAAGFGAGKALGILWDAVRCGG